MFFVSILQEPSPIETMRRRYAFFLIACLLLVSADATASTWSKASFKQVYKRAQEQAGQAEQRIPSMDDCFCKLNGEVDECNCKIDYIDKFNNYKIHPRINALVSQHNFFRYIKINLKKICQFWPDDARCSLKDCHVTTCSEDDLPEHFKKHFQEQQAKALQQQQKQQLNNANSENNEVNFKSTRFFLSTTQFLLD